MILVLGGTGDAHRVALDLKASGVEFIVSLAGVTRRPIERSYPVRTGGFGGVGGLIEYLDKEEIAGLIDATHPFAENISNSAARAAQTTGVPLIRFARPEWQVPESSEWVLVGNLDAAARALPGRARAFLTVGSNGLQPFVCRSDVWFLFRGIDPMDNPFTRGEALVQRPPFTLESEIALMKDHAITHLVTKNAGDAQTRAKIDAATELGIPVIMVERPVLPVVESASTVSDILRWAKAI